MSRSIAWQIGLLSSGAFIALIIFVLFAAHQVIDVRQSRAGAPMGEIVAGHSVGQTLVAHRPGFDRLDLLLATYARTNPGQLEVEITPADGRGPSQRLSIASASIADNQYRAFTFGPIIDSVGREFVVRLSSPDAAPGRAVTAWSAPADVYAEGAALTDDHVVPSRDLTFIAYARLSPWDWLDELVQGVSRDRGAILVVILLLFLPGLALLGALGFALDLELISTITLAPGLSICVVALFYLWANALGIPITIVSLEVLLVAALPLAVLAVRRASLRIGWDMVGLAILFVLATATQLAIVNRVDVPLWGDSYQHTLIVRLLLDHHGLFSNWAPYADLQSFTYHFGFHSFAASLATLAGLSAPEAVIVSAQSLAVVAALTSAGFARATGARQVGILTAMVVVSFFSPMPSYFVNWGRDTQLAGLVVLGSVGALWLRSFRIFPGRRRLCLALLALLAIVVAGLGLTHYREVLIWGMFVVAWLITEVGLSKKSDLSRGAACLASAGIVCIGALLLAGPWLPRLLDFAQNAQGLPSPSVSWSAEYNAFGDFGFFVPWPLLALAAAGLGWRLLRRGSDAIMLALWVAGCFAVANLPLLGRPAGSLVNNFAVEIGLFVPVSIGIGWLADDLVFFLRKRMGPAGRKTPRYKFFPAVTFGVLFGLACVGSTYQIGILDRNQALVLDGDRLALNWIRSSTPSNARFLVNSFLGMGGTVAVGSDAGWWLPLLAERQTTLPPVNYTDERMPSGQRDLVHQLAAFPPNAWGTPAGLRLLRQARVSYIFLGAAGGRLSPADFDGRQVFQPVFVSGPTRVYRVDEQSK